MHCDGHHSTAATASTREQMRKQLWKALVTLLLTQAASAFVLVTPSSSRSSVREASTRVRRTAANSEDGFVTKRYVTITNRLYPMFMLEQLQCEVTVERNHDSLYEVATGTSGVESRWNCSQVGNIDRV